MSNYDDAIEAGYALAVPEEMPAMVDSAFSVDTPVPSRYPVTPDVYTAIVKRKLDAMKFLAENPIEKAGKAVVKGKGGKVLYTYSYYRPEDVYAAANAACLHAGLDITPVLRGTQQFVSSKTQYGTPMLMTRVYLDMYIGCEEGVQVIPWAADSQMNDPSKSLQACLTYGHRLFLQHYFRLSVEEGPPVGKAEGEPVTWNQQFWEFVQQLEYWNDSAGIVDREYFFQTMRQHWPDEEIPSLDETTARDIYIWAREFVKQRRQQQSEPAPSPNGAPEQPQPDSDKESERATDELLGALDEQFGIDREAPDIVKYTDAPAEPPEYKTDDWQERFWNDIARLGYWTNDDGEVNKHHFHASRRKWYEDRPEKIPSLVYENAGLIYRWAWNYATHKALSERQASTATDAAHSEDSAPESEQPEGE